MTYEFIFSALTIIESKLNALGPSDGKRITALRHELVRAVGLLTTEASRKPWAPLSAAQLLQTFAPSVVDVLAEVAEESVRQASLRLSSAKRGAESGNLCRIPGFLNDWPAYVAQAQADCDDEVRKAQPTRDEWDRRGGWRRYFLVTNACGHIHSDMSCETCFPATKYKWLAELSGCDETTMIEVYGTRACSFCFPHASTLPAWGVAARREAEEKASKAAKVCPGSGRHPNGKKPMQSTICPECGVAVVVTQRGWGRLRKHNRKEIK